MKGLDSRIGPQLFVLDGATVVSHEGDRLIVALERSALEKVWAVMHDLQFAAEAQALHSDGRTNDSTDSTSA